MRLFKDEPKWTPLNRAPELEKNPHRKAYLQDKSAKAGMMTWMVFVLSEYWLEPVNTKNSLRQKLRIVETYGCKTF